jgi:aspartate/methionine/tyrosine aminotransferase
MEPAQREVIFARTRAIVRRNWPMLDGWIRERGGFLGCIPPRAGAIVLVQYDLPIASIALAERLRVEKSVLVVPGDQLGAPRHLRIGFGYGGGDGSMQGGLRRIDEMLGAIRTAAPARRRRVTAPGSSGRRRSRSRGR